MSLFNLYQLLPLTSLFMFFIIWLIPDGYIKTLFKAILVIVILFLIALVIGLRPLDSGSDTISYVSSFLELSKTPEFSWDELSTIYKANNVSFVEPLFAIFTYALSRFTSDPQVYLFVCALVSLAILLLAYRNFTSEYDLIFIAFITTFTCVFIYSNTLRQAFAVSIVTYALSLFFLEKNKGKFCFYIVIASLFHLYAIFFILFLYVNKISVRKRVLIIFPLFFFSWIFPVVFSYILSLIGIDFLNVKLETYQGDYSVLNFNLLSGVLFLLIMYFIGLKVDHDRFNGFVNIYSGVFLIQLCFVSSEIAFGRMGAYRFVLEPIALFLIVSLVSFKKTPIIINYFILALLIVLYSAYTSSTESIIFNLT